MVNVSWSPLGSRFLVLLLSYINLPQILPKSITFSLSSSLPVTHTHTHTHTHNLVPEKIRAHNALPHITNPPTFAQGWVLPTEVKARPGLEAHKAHQDGASQTN